MTEIDDLDSLLDMAATQRVMPSDALVTCILANADATQPKPALARPAVPCGWFQALADWFGGGMSLAGMSAAALTGLYLGVVQPLPVVALTELVTGTTTLDSPDLLPATGTLWTQE